MDRFIKKSRDPSTRSRAIHAAVSTHLQRSITPEIPRASAAEPKKLNSYQEDPKG
jgi:hypothetical protein